MLFTCLDSAFEEAQFLANELRDCGQRRSAYIAQRHDSWNVTRRRPTDKLAMTVNPVVKDSEAKGVSFVKSRKHLSKWRATHYHGLGNVKFLGWHREQGQALAAVKKYKETLNVISTDR